MKNYSKALMLVLAFAMVLSCVSVYAEPEESKVVQYGVWNEETQRGGYVAFGDSVSRGCGATTNYAKGYKAAEAAGYNTSQDEFYDYTYYNLNYRRMNNSLSYLVAQGVGCKIDPNFKKKEPSENTFVNCCIPGMTLTQVMDYLEIEDAYYDAEYDHNEDVSKNIEYLGTYLNETKDRVKTAGLITIELGLCDVMWRPMALANINTDNTVDWVTSMLEGMYSGYNQWIKSYEIFLQQLREWNQTATIVMVGAYNPMMNMTVNDEDVLPVGQAVSIIVKMMNDQYREWADQYGTIFVDISNVDTCTSENGWSYTGEAYNNNSTIGGHPTIEGNTYLARQVLAALPKEGEEIDADPLPSTNIVLDIGKFKSVSLVSVDGKVVSNYSVEDHVLTVPYLLTNAKVLTLVIVQDDGRIAVYTYQLSYDQGYTAYRIYSTSDVVGTVSRINNGLRTLVKSAVSKMTEWFQK